MIDTNDIDKLRVQVATLASENRRLRRLKVNRGPGAILYRARADALQLTGWRFAGYSVSRRACEGYGMSWRRWQWAVALLRLAGVLAIDSPAADEFQVDDPAECAARIDKAVARVERADSLSMLEFRLPRGVLVRRRRALG